MKTHKLYSKSEVSHKPNIFFGTYEQRLIDLNNIRSSINEEENPLEILSQIYFYCPRTKTKTDEYKIDTWLEPWQLIERNEYNEFDLSLLLCYTIMITEQFKDSQILIHNVISKEIESNNRKFSYVIEFNNQFLNVNDMVIMTKELFDKDYVLHYTHNIKNKINIDLI